MDILSKTSAGALARFVHKYRVDETEYKRSVSTLGTYLSGMGASSKDAALKLSGLLCWASPRKGTCRPNPAAMREAGLGPDKRPDLWATSMDSVTVYVK